MHVSGWQVGVLAERCWWPFDVSQGTGSGKGLPEDDVAKHRNCWRCNMWSSIHRIMHKCWSVRGDTVVFRSTVTVQVAMHKKGGFRGLFFLRLPRNMQRCLRLLSERAKDKECLRRHFRLLPRCRWVLHSCGILRGLWCRISWPLKMGPIGCPETSVRNYHSTLCKIPEERRCKSVLLCISSNEIGLFEERFSIGVWTQLIT
jgi:hypothetical protein